MDNIDETKTVNERIAKNLIYYRKSAGLTQAELAQKINYSDKSVSKWESGNGVPDIYILLQLAELYKVSINDLVSEMTPEKMIKQRTSKIGSSLIMILSAGIVMLVAVVMFVFCSLIAPNFEWWLVFILACPSTAIVITVLSAVFKRKKTNFVAVSLLIWTVLLSVFMVTLVVLKHKGIDYDRLWLLFLLGIPLQVLEIFWVFFRSVKKKNKQQFSEL